jgi:predicted lipid-binding transport protein (Tim44 family)
MSGQILELIIFAGIAFFIIQKLISSFGKTSDDDPARRSFFGENRDSNLKDVTYTGGTAAPSILRPKFLRSKKIDLNGLIVADNKDVIEEGLKEVMEKMPSFNIERFLNASKAAFSIIIEAAQAEDNDQLGELIDKRYIDKFKSLAASYGGLTENSDKISTQISEIYTFGNNIFIKVIFSGKNITKKIKDLQEEWTFSRSAISSDLVWYLMNIDRAA